MTDHPAPVSRRALLAGSLAAVTLAGGAREDAMAAGKDRALIAITLDLEMSRNFPEWDDLHWDYEKGNLNEETRKYTVEACRRVKARGGVLHALPLARASSRRVPAGCRRSSGRVTRSATTPTTT
jgi:hypothetical protein